MLSLNYVCNKNTICAIFHSVVSRDFFGKPISAGIWGKGGCDALMWVQGKAQVEPGGKAPRSSKGLVLLNHFWLKYTIYNLWWN